MNENHAVVTTRLSAWWHTYRQLERVTGSQSGDSVGVA